MFCVVLVPKTFLSGYSGFERLQIERNRKPQARVSLAMCLLLVIVVHLKLLSNFVFRLSNNYIIGGFILEPRFILILS